MLFLAKYIEFVFVLAIVTSNVLALKPDSRHRNVHIHVQRLLGEEEAIGPKGESSFAHSNQHSEVFARTVDERKINYFILRPI